MKNKYLKNTWSIESTQMQVIKAVYRAIGLMGRVFANGPGDSGSIPGWVIPKTKKIVLDAT